SDTGRRGSRWLFSALHSFDLPLLLKYRPLRDALMIILSIAVLIVSVSGIVVGWRYLRRPAKATTTAAPARVPRLPQRAATGQAVFSHEELLRRESSESA